MKIVSGRTGSPHVTSQQFRQMLEGIIGQGSYIITSGENLKPELSSNNLLKIRKWDDGASRLYILRGYWYL